ncbi:uncharacterized protein [Henckelia pumila]|uniref:uncharacterized protein isoform X2 n=1 Tax=Henckelia pumila TaxID=405737 RepID=UPI003C6E0B96
MHPPAEREGAADLSSELRKRIAKIDKDMQRKLSEIKKKKKELVAFDAGLGLLAKLAVLIKLVLSELPVRGAPLVVEPEQVERGVHKLLGKHVPVDNDERTGLLYSTMNELLELDFVQQANTVHFQASEDGYGEQIIGEIEELYNELRSLQSEKDAAEERLRS